LEGGFFDLFFNFSKRWLFDVRSFYSVLVYNDGIPFSWKNIWWTKVPLRVSFFAWSADLRKILTMDNLRKRHIIVVDRCCCVRGMCSLWTIFFSTLRLLVSYGMFASVALGCFGLCLDELSTYLLVSGLLVALRVLLCGRWCPRLLWCLWMERYDMSFGDWEKMLEELKVFLFSTLYHLTTTIVCPLELSFHDFFALFLILARCFFYMLSVYLGEWMRFTLLMISRIYIKEETNLGITLTFPMHHI